MKKILIAICLLSGLTSCHHDDDTPEDNTARRTVLVYMAAENNLTRFATEDLEEMKTGSLKLAEDQNLVIYVDKAGSLTTPYIVRAKNGEMVDTIFMKEALSADPTTLQDVIQYTREHFPAKSYGLLLWGHASGWLVSTKDSISRTRGSSILEPKAYGGATGNNSSSSSGNYWMNIVPMAKAIQNGMGSDHLSFIFGDCCSFGCLEVAYELRNVTDYVIGSPAEVPDMGAPFDLIVPDMFIETDNFYAKIIDHYFDYYLDIFKNNPQYYNKKVGDLAGYSVPLAVVKTSGLDNLAYATSTLLGTIAEKVSTSGSLDLDKVMYYAISQKKYSYDMYHVFKKNTSAADFDTWKAAFLQAVPYRLFSMKWMTEISSLRNEMENFDATKDDCGVVSMFFPSTYYNGTNPNWNKAIQQYQWNNVIHWEQYGW
jgi:hypothetical protein